MMIGPDIWIVTCRECSESGRYENMRPDNPTMQAWKAIKHKVGCSAYGVIYKQAREDKLFEQTVVMS